MRAHFESITGGTILIVANEPDLCLLMKIYFLRKGCRVFTVHSCGDALSALERMLPDAVIIFLPPCEKNAAFVDGILQQAPEVQLITYNADVIYNKHESPD